MCLVQGVSLGRQANLRCAELSSYTLDLEIGLSSSVETISLKDLEFAGHLGVCTSLLKTNLYIYVMIL